MGECGEVLRILGDLPAAEAAYERAVGFGYEAQPGPGAAVARRAAVPAAAVGAVRRLLAEPRDPVHRSQLLPGAVEVLLAAGEVDAGRRGRRRARRASRRRSGARPCGRWPTTRGAARCSPAGEAERRCPSSAGRWPGGGRSTRRTRRRAHACSWARRCASLGDEESATGEIAAARADVRHDLGAVPAEREAARLLGTAHPAGLTDREVEVLRLVARGSSNPEIAATLVLSEKTVARHLSNIFTKLDVGSRTAAAAFAFENGLV